MKIETVHCCILQAGDVGLMISGPSGSGKTSLMFGLHERLCQDHISCKIIADDYALLSADGGKLLAKAPDAIAGKAEVRGYGVVPIQTSSEAVSIDLNIVLLPDEDIERMPSRKFSEIMGFEIVRLEVPQRHEQGAARIIFAWLRDNTDMALPLPGA